MTEDEKKSLFQNCLLGLPGSDESFTPEQVLDAIKNYEHINAEKLKAQIIEESKTEARKMITSATAEIERKYQEAMATLKEEIVEIAVNASGKIIRESLDKEKQKTIIDKYIQELPKN